jgi:3-oxoacyl-[acyl-carrier protein] reductase
MAAPTAEHHFNADGQSWDPAALSTSMREYFTGRDPERTFGATGLMPD